MKFLHLDLRSRFSKKTMREALVSLLAEKRLEKISVTDICIRAFINRGTFYRYYKSVPELYEHVEDEILSHMLSSILTDPIAFSDNVYHDVLTELRDNKELHIFINNSDGKSQFAEKAVLYVKESVIAGWKIKYPEKSETELAYIFSFLAAGAIRVVMKWFENGCKEDIDTMCTILRSLNCFPERK